MPRSRLPLVLLIVALTLACLPVPSRAAEGPQSCMFDAKGLKIHYILAGQGPPVLLIHGLFASAEINWGINAIIRDLARDHQVIAVDLPGHGLSDGPDTPGIYGVHVIDDLLMLLDDLKIKKTQVVGYSLGGMIAIKLMATHPDRVVAAGVGGMGWFRDGSGLQKIWDQFPAKGLRPPVSFLRSIGEFAVTEDDLKKINLPVEVIVGSDDEIKVLYVKPLEKVRPDWPVLEVAGAGHITCIIKKDFHDDVLAWVRKNTK